jgi:hypothetical protein
MLADSGTPSLYHRPFEGPTSLRKELLSWILAIHGQIAQPLGYFCISSFNLISNEILRHVF